MADLTDLQKKLLAFRDDRDWKQFHNPKDMAISLSLEASELLEHFQWKNGDQLDEYIQQHKEEISDELADVLNWIVLMAHDMDIDIVDVANKKVDKNAKKYPVDKAHGSIKKYTEYEK